MHTWTLHPLPKGLLIYLRSKTRAKRRAGSLLPGSWHACLLIAFCVASSTQTIISLHATLVSGSIKLKKRWVSCQLEYFVFSCSSRRGGRHIDLTATLLSLSLFSIINFYILTLMSPRIDSQFPAQLAVTLVAKHRKNEIHSCSKLPESRVSQYQYRYPIRPGNYSSWRGKFNCVYYEGGGMYYCCLHLDVMWDVKEMETLLSTHSSILFKR